MRIALAERFRRDVLALDREERAAVFEVILSLPQGIGRPHEHRGSGVRKLHRSGIWEARVGLGLRIVFAVERDLITLVRAGSHDAVTKYLRGL